MRKLVLIASLVLASAAAQAGESRSLTLAANDDAATAQPAPAPPAATDTPKYVERPAAVDTSVPPAGQPKADAGAKPSHARVARPKHKPYWTEARVISELHRHGVYW
ncbi:hypothetical protein [Bradyrhizobium sp.]|uniref:hypothetical protein n=1 Tax=Bradyrhizobium sp. TaxID=376 RepID=UPI003C3D0B3B